MKQSFQKQINENKLLTKEILDKLENKEYTSGRLKQVGDKPLYCFIVEVVDGNNVEMTLGSLCEDELDHYEKRYELSEVSDPKNLPMLMAKKLIPND